VVIAAVENRPAPIEDPIHGSSQTRAKAFHPIRQGYGSIRLDQQVDVVVLNGIMDDPELLTLFATTQSPLECANQAHDPQGRNVLANPDGDEPRQPAWKIRALAMQHARPRRRLPPSADSRATAMHRLLQLEGKLSASRHTTPYNVES
jgi:hypothetical protein